MIATDMTNGMGWIGMKQYNNGRFIFGKDMYGPMESDRVMKHNIILTFLGIL
jgi:hypothetical protein